MGACSHRRQYALPFAFSDDSPLLISSTSNEVAISNIGVRALMVFSIFNLISCSSFLRNCIHPFGAPCFVSSVENVYRVNGSTGFSVPSKLRKFLSVYWQVSTRFGDVQYVSEG